MNLETKEKMHVTGRGHACPVDGYVCFRNSELLTGRVGKATLGGGNKAGLFQARSLCVHSTCAWCPQRHATTSCRRGALGRRCWSADMLFASSG